MRLDKFIAGLTDFSRREVHIMVKRSRICVNGVIEKSAARILKTTDEVTVDDERVEAIAPRYLMLYKPAGVVCANTDSEHPTVIDLLSLPNKQDLQIAGRLDVDTTGLVLLTDDGQWNHRATSPTRKCSKTYLINTASPIASGTVELFKQGVQLHGEDKLTRPAELVIIDDHTARLSISEGRYHQVKRMFAAMGNRVVNLHRETIGSISLDPSLSPGEFRPLTAEEIGSI